MRKKHNAGNSVEAKTPLAKLGFQKYSDKVMSATEVIQLYFFSKIAENAAALLAGEDTWLDNGGFCEWPKTLNVCADKWHK